MTRPAARFPRSLARFGWLAALTLGACRLRRRRLGHARLRRRLSQADRLSDPRHRRLQIPRDDRLERGREQRRQIRLDQGDRGRRPCRRAVPGQLAGREARRRSARRLSLHVLVPDADRRSDLVRAERAGRGRRAAAGARRRADARLAHLPPPSRARPDDRRHESGARRNGAPFRQAAGHLHQPRLLQRDPRRRRLRRLSDLGALDQAQSGDALQRPRLAVLAIPGQRNRAGHRRRSRPQRLSTATRTSGRRSSTGRARRRKTPRRPPRPRRPRNRRRKRTSRRRRRSAPTTKPPRTEVRRDAARPISGCADPLELYDPEIGGRARSAVGIAEAPLNAAVGIEAETWAAPAAAASPSRRAPAAPRRSAGS